MTFAFRSREPGTRLGAVETWCVEGVGENPPTNHAYDVLLTPLFLVRRLAREAISGTPCPTSPNLENSNLIDTSGMFCKAGPSGLGVNQYRPISFTRGTFGELVVTQGSSRPISLPYSALEGGLKPPPTHLLAGLNLLRSQASYNRPILGSGFGTAPTPNTSGLTENSGVRGSGRGQTRPTPLSTNLEFYDRAKQWHCMHGGEIHYSSRTHAPLLLPSTRPPSASRGKSGIALQHR